MIRYVEVGGPCAFLHYLSWVDLDDYDYTLYDDKKYYDSRRRLGVAIDSLQHRPVYNIYIYIYFVMHIFSGETGTRPEGKPIIRYIKKNLRNSGCRYSSIKGAGEMGTCVRS
jgi:hypothetical protein